MRRAPEGQTTPVCPFFSTCGGCDTQDVAYRHQIAVKDAWLRTLFAGSVRENLWEPFVASQEEYPVYFRNKIRFGFVEEDGIIRPSRHAKGEEQADIPVDACFLQSELSVAITLFTATFATEHEWKVFEIDKGTGWLKHLLVREAKHTGECLVSLVTTQTNPAFLSDWVIEIQKRFPQVSGVYQTITQGKNNELSIDLHLAGRTHILETVGEYGFYISLHAFFQTNGAMVETLYGAIGRHAQISSSDVVWDLYAGSATIGIFLHKSAREVLSIESNPENCADARMNITENNVPNVNIYEGSVESVLTSPFILSHAKPSVIIVDPPRAGLSTSLKNLLPNLGKHRLVYVSCNPASCLRDCGHLTDRGYVVTSAQGIDMFPHSYHCEMIVTLSRS
jgi:23S rRNA (uracil1939-C5)-methyltransferase